MEVFTIAVVCDSFECAKSISDGIICTYSDKYVIKPVVYKNNFESYSTSSLGTEVYTPYEKTDLYVNKYYPTHKISKKLKIKNHNELTNEFIMNIDDELFKFVNGFNSKEQFIEKIYDTSVRYNLLKSILEVESIQLASVVETEPGRITIIRE
jgi:hypothetical protein